MAITFIEPKRKRQYLVLLSIAIVLAVSFLVWNYFLAKPASPVSKPTPPAEIKIDFEILKNPILEKLQPFEEIPPFEEGIGRENPFLPY